MTTEEPVNTSNDIPDKTHEITVGCDLLWSLAQQFAYLRLSDKTGDNEYKFIGLYAARARRIAATYARFYLETEDGGDTDKTGRYYWMALGAFASKTVACILDSWQVQTSYFTGTISLGITDMKAIANGLGRGNLWLYNDIAPAHWFYNRYPEHFFNGMICLNKRDANDLREPVKVTLNNLPWASESLGPVNHFKPSPYIIDGFEKVLQIERTNAGALRSELQLEHLLAIADHEQREVLQPLIYNDPVFKKWMSRGRERDFWTLWGLASLTYQLVFTHQCEDSDPQLKSVAPGDMKVEEEESRMAWIEDAANMFHELMNDEEAHMMNELRTIAAWVNSPDARFVY
ncbi:MAG: hypothetical protein L3J98_12575 [Gammaproteobacteria bacterium]|nr:hypothetical protein [Gammaproteobacteria bacterium]